MFREQVVCTPNLLFEPLPHSKRRTITASAVLELSTGWSPTNAPGVASNDRHVRHCDLGGLDQRSSRSTMRRHRSRKNITSDYGTVALQVRTCVFLVKVRPVTFDRNRVVFPQRFDHATLDERPLQARWSIWLKWDLLCVGNVTFDHVPGLSTITRFFVRPSRRHHRGSALDQGCQPSPLCSAGCSTARGSQSSTTYHMLRCRRVAYQISKIFSLCTFSGQLGFHENTRLVFHFNGLCCPDRG